MLSIETEVRVASLLLSLAEGERNIEISRQVLSDNFDFDAYQIFKYLDVDNKNRVNAIDIVNFLNNKHIYNNNNDNDVAKLTILFYDQDADGSLSYIEFLNLVQSEQSLRRNSPFPKQSKLSFNVEYSLRKLLEKELELSQHIIELLNELKLRCDFNVHDVYHVLKNWNGITNESIKSFLNRNAINYLNNDVKSIMKRLDVNKDGRIDICELHAFLGFPTCRRCCPCATGCECKCYSCCCCCNSCSISHCIAVDTPYQTNSPVKKNESLFICTSNNNTATKYATINNTINNVNASALYQTINTPDRCIPPSQHEMKLTLRHSPERKYSPQRHTYSNVHSHSNNNIHTITTTTHEQTQFIEYLRVLMDAESSIEKVKTELSLHIDFNVEDAFRIFEVNGRGYITEDDLREGLNVLEMYPTRSDVRFLMKRFDLQKKGVINYADFFDMVTPYEKQYRIMVEQRTPNSCCACRCPDVFMCSTIITLKCLFNMLIEYEKKFYALRKGFAMLRYKLKEVFGGLDRFGLGGFDEEDLIRYLKENYAFNSVKDADLLFIRLDRDRNGKIAYWELEEE